MRLSSSRHDAAQGRAAAQVVEHQALPVGFDLLGGLGVAVAGHVDEGQAAAEVEEIELPRAARVCWRRAPARAGRSAR